MIPRDELIRVEFLLKQIALIEKDLNNKKFEEFQKSDLLVRATSFSLMQIGEQMNKLEKIFRDRYPTLPWSDARDMRNIIVHVYSKIDALQVYDTAKKDLNELKEAFNNIKQELSESL